ncbi:hypothetical protein QJS10_CPA01g02460 [Acorus calamus]|uniref:WD repeat-containing protein 44 n=1 Tax=Acorus calamus TaxID=4465 RepID=A0AAV9FM83_ACOCL|nr:hypothetical protein QJS10_CPA01g02460 [Acorus calamus]
MGVWLKEEEEEELFFDTRSDLSIDSPSSAHRSDGEVSSLNWVPGDPLFDVWIDNPVSLSERRRRFLRLMDLGDQISGSIEGEIEAEIDRTADDSGAVLRGTDSEGGLSSSRLSAASDRSDGSSSNCPCSIKNLDDGKVFIVDDDLGRLREVDTGRVVREDEYQRAFGLSPLVERLMRREVSSSTASTASDLDESSHRRGRRSIGWLRRLGVAACIMDREGDESGFCSLDDNRRARMRRVKVRPSKKRAREFSAVYMGQEFQAHDGAILSMKFSPDGRYMASGGEDGVVRVWEVMEVDRADGNDVPGDDPSCLYFTVNPSSELAPIFMGKEKVNSCKGMKKTSESACVVVPPEVFQISERPLHEFRGHGGDVLDLSWSKDNKYLLSSSMDKTVRLWQVGCNTCLKVFCHNDYVTCVQFNPVKEDYFISGSIDGKVRIWAIPGCRVVNWIDVKEIVTAVCYRPDGQGGIVGSISGTCRFYDASDNHLQLLDQICFQSKKKFPGKRITGLQFSPSDPRKLMVTSADSQVRVLDESDVICKYRGFHNTGSQISASFTSDGRHIISASEDSNVYIWNSSNQDTPTPMQAKTISSYERFFSENASVAIPWCGNSSRKQVFGDPNSPSDSSYNAMLSSSGRFTLTHGFFSESLSKDSATWPEEKLPASTPLTASPSLCRSKYRFLKASCQNTVASQAWGLVIVTAGWDGRIRSFHNYGLPVRM